MIMVIFKQRFVKGDFKVRQKMFLLRTLKQYFWYEMSSTILENIDDINKRLIIV